MPVEVLCRFCVVADFEKAKTLKEISIQILYFADLSSILPIYFDKALVFAKQKYTEKQTMVYYLCLRYLLLG